MRHYCTLFDSRYLPQGLALYESLRKHSSEPFALHVLPMDADCAATLARMVLPGMQLVLGFHDQPHMREAKARHNHREYCWLSASNFCECLLDQFELPEVTYLDADTLAYADPAPVFDEIGDKSIAITPHRLIPSKQYLERNGRFNVGWVSIKNTPTGMACVSRWAAQCRERCSEDYGCGDQFYLNEWESLYESEVHVIENIGVNAGPWSIGNWKVTDGPKLDGHQLILYHAHEFLQREDGTFRLTNYDLRPEDVELIYVPYIKAVEAAQAKLRALQTQTV